MSAMIYISSRLPLRRVVASRRTFRFPPLSYSVVFCSGGTVGLDGTKKEITLFKRVADISVKAPKLVAVDFKDPHTWFADLSTDAITKINVKSVKLDPDDQECEVRLLILPRELGEQSALDWPTFHESKQFAALGRGIVLERGAPLVTEDDTPVVDALLSTSTNVALLGHPGIGKSTEINLVFVSLFQALKDGKLHSVYHRANSELYRYKINKRTREITCSLEVGAGKSLDTLGDYFKRYKGEVVTDDSGRTTRTAAVLVLEMKEKESDPDFEAIPFIVALPSREADKVVKTLAKGRLITFVPRPPHTEAEIVVLATALYHAGAQAGLCKYMGLSTGSSLNEVVQAVRQRINTIGPLTRQILSPITDFELWKNEMFTTLNVDRFLNLLNQTSRFNLPGTAKYYLAPAADGTNHILGETHAKLIFENAQDAHIRALRASGIAWQMSDKTFITYYLLGYNAPAHQGKDLPDAWNHRQWEFYKNPGAGVPLKTEHKLTDDEADALRADHMKHETKTYFQSSVLPESIDKWSSEAVYISMMHAMPVGECATVNVDKTRLSLYQSSTVDPSKHVFSLSALRKWVTAVQPKELHIVYFTDWADKDTKGIAVDDLADDDAVSRELFGEAGKFKSYIIRSGIYKHVHRMKLATFLTDYAETLQKYKTALKDGGGGGGVDFENIFNKYSKDDLLDFGRDAGVSMDVMASKAVLVGQLLDKLKPGAPAVQGQVQEVTQVTQVTKYLALLAEYKRAGTRRETGAFWETLLKRSKSELLELATDAGVTTNKMDTKTVLVRKLLDKLRQDAPSVQLQK